MASEKETSLRDILSKISQVRMEISRIHEEISNIESIFSPSFIPKIKSSHNEVSIPSSARPTIQKILIAQYNHEIYKRHILIKNLENQL